MKVNSQTIMVELTTDYVTGMYHLDDSYNVTQFRAGEKAITLTLDNGTHDLTVKIKGCAKHDLEIATTRKLEELGYIDAEEEEEDEEELD